MFDAISITGLVAAGAIGWFMCLINPRVFWGWKLVAPIAIIFPSAFVIVALLDGRALSTAFWSGMRVDWLTLGLALAPVLVWPIRAAKPRPARGSAQGVARAL